MKKRNLLFLLAFFAVAALRAETVKWFVQPTYSKITYYSTDIFKCEEHDGKIHLIDQNGKDLLDGLDADAVTDYSGGYAIVSKGDKILGFLSDKRDHQFVKINGNYYITKYSFFSEGFLVVAEGNVSGRQGYLDTNGDVFINCEYLEAKPFRHGWAVVKKDGGDRTKYCSYISSDKKTENFGIIGLGGGRENIVEATSFNEEGYAMARGINGKFVVFNSFRNPQIVNVKSISEMMDPYDGSYKSETSPKVVKPSNSKPSNVKENIVVFTENGKSGYKTSEGEIVLPCQFSSAQPFYDNWSIVEKNGMFGIVELMKGSFIAHWPEGNGRVYPDGARKKQHFSLDTPSPFDGDQLCFEFDEGDSNFKSIKSFDFDFQPAFNDGANMFSLRGKVTFGELILWEASKEYGVDYISVDIKAPTVTSTYADENDNQIVKTVITNTSKISFMIDATLKVGGQSVPFKGKLSPNQSKTLTATIKVKENGSTQATVTTKTDGHSCGSKTSTISLKKI